MTAHHQMGKQRRFQYLTLFADDVRACLISINPLGALGISAKSPADCSGNPFGKNDWLIRNSKYQ
jgi:hypothetical protein